HGFAGLVLIAPATFALWVAVKNPTDRLGQLRGEFFRAAHVFADRTRAARLVIVTAARVFLRRVRRIAENHQLRRILAGQSAGRIPFPLRVKDLEELAGTFALAGRKRDAQLMRAVALGAHTPAARPRGHVLDAKLSYARHCFASGLLPVALFALFVFFGRLVVVVDFFGFSVRCVRTQIAVLAHFAYVAAARVMLALLLVLGLLFALGLGFVVFMPANFHARLPENLSLRNPPITHVRLPRRSTSPQRSPSR